MEIMIIFVSGQRAEVEECEQEGGKYSTSEGYCCHCKGSDGCYTEIGTSCHHQSYHPTMTIIGPSYEPVLLGCGLWMVLMVSNTALLHNFVPVWFDMLLLYDKSR